MENSLCLKTILSFAFLIVGIFYFILGISGIIKRLSQRSWLNTEAKIINCDIIPLDELLLSQPLFQKIVTVLGLITTIVEFFQSDGDRVLNMNVSYTYSFSGISFDANEALRQRSHYQPGDIVKCLVNPSIPAEAAIKQNIGFSILYFLVGAALIGIGIFMLAVLR